LREDGIVLEPAWALAIDALKDLKERIKWKTVVVIISWWNFDFERLPEIKERSMKYEWLKKYLIVSFPQRPGALKEFLSVLWENDDIIRFEYLKKSVKEKAPALIWIETNNPKNFDEIFKKMKGFGIAYEDITNKDIYYDLLI
jgi:threonine dehydratase